MPRTAAKKRAAERTPKNSMPANPASTGEFAAMLDETFGGKSSLEGNVIEGRVIAIENDFVMIDVGLKSDGRIPLREFSLAGQPSQLKAGDKVEVFLERMEDRNGEVGLSREKAKREES